MPVYALHSVRTRPFPTVPLLLEGVQEEFTDDLSWVLVFIFRLVLVDDLLHFREGGGKQSGLDKIERKSYASARPKCPCSPLLRPYPRNTDSWLSIEMRRGTLLNSWSLWSV